MASSHQTQLGQFFTKSPKVQQLIANLIQNPTGHALEPSAGEGHLAQAIGQHHPALTLTSVEIDGELPWVGPNRPIITDFFVWATQTTKRFTTIFGNPPYVAWKNVTDQTKQHCHEIKQNYSGKTNLYHLFIDRCIDLLEPKGELIFIVPKEWLYATAAAPLRHKLLTHGAITHLVDCGEEKLFGDATPPALIVFRYQKNTQQSTIKFAKTIDTALSTTWDRLKLHTNADRWILLEESLATQIASWGQFKDLFDVKVGLVTGLDRAYKTGPDCVEPEATQTQITTKKTVEHFINVNWANTETEIPPLALKHLQTWKPQLLNRKIADFNENNWWKYGAVRNEALMSSKTNRFYVLAKTRNPEPFFENPQGSGAYTGGVLGVFIKPHCDTPVASLVAAANSALFRQVLEAMFLTTGDRLSLQPKTLEEAPFPTTPEGIETLAATNKNTP
ncbi:MAG: N-6 DNA methylase [Acidimicrobiia bacterium]